MIKINLIRRPAVNLDQFRKSPLLTLKEALQKSEWLHRAARPYLPGYMVMSDGIRFWTCTDKLDGMYVIPYAPDFLMERNDKLWRPVLGDEKGWRVA